MEVKRIEPSFGMVIKNPRTPYINAYLDSLPARTAKKIINLSATEMENKVPVYLTMIMKYCKPKFAVEVGDKIFKENFLQGPITTLKRGIKYARKLNREQEAVNNAWGDTKISTRI